ncbi:hypothetical protein CB1_000274003 [Camelus ferus]|nr:hypothetical protein CB1_000274003 [Camelus ferus]
MQLTHGCTAPDSKLHTLSAGSPLSHTELKNVTDERLHVSPLPLEPSVLQQNFTLASLHFVDMEQMGFTITTSTTGSGELSPAWNRALSVVPDRFKRATSCSVLEGHTGCLLYKFHTMQNDLRKMCQCQVHHSLHLHLGLCLCLHLHLCLRLHHLCVYIYTYIYIYTYVFIYVYIIYIYVCIYIYVYVYIYVYTYIYVYIYIYIIYTYVYINIYFYIYVYTYICVYIIYVYVHDKERLLNVLLGGSGSLIHCSPVFFGVSL